MSSDFTKTILAAGAGYLAGKKASGQPLSTTEKGVAVMIGTYALLDHLETKSAEKKAAENTNSVGRKTLNDYYNERKSNEPLTKELAEYVRTNNDRAASGTSNNELAASETSTPKVDVVKILALYALGGLAWFACWLIYKVIIAFNP
jgi:hypothetical protein